ncbi:hypothetical protein ACFL96_03085 [Thermoproteota archaeon]
MPDIEIKEIEKLKGKVKKLSAVLDFYDDLGKRKLTSKKEFNDAKLKLDFAKKQMLKLCMESKNIIKKTEKRDAV